MKIYNTPTQEDYDALMSELEVKGYKWLSGYEPTEYSYWEQEKKNSCIKISGKDIAFKDIKQCKKQYPNTPIIEYKAKGENMTQEEMKQNIFDWATDVSIAAESFSRNIKFKMKKSTAEADLKEAKSSAKKLIEKIDEYLESLKPKFKVGDYVTDTSDDDPFICKIEKIKGNDISGKWYCVANKYFDRLAVLPASNSRLSNAEEIAEYESALSFHKHGRKPFEVKRGDVVYPKGYDKNIFLDSGNIYKKHNFIDGDVGLVKTVEEVNEWLGADDDK